MSLDDEIGRARATADTREQADRQAADRAAHEAQQALALGRDAARRLLALGPSMRFVQVAPAKWHTIFCDYRDRATGTRYSIVSAQCCWVITESSGLRHGKGEWMTSPVLLLEDGSVGRFWPIPALTPASDTTFVSSIPLDPITADSVGLLAFSSRSGSYLSSLTRELADTVVRYERGYRYGDYSRQNWPSTRH